MNGTYKIVGIDRLPGESEPDMLRIGDTVNIARLAVGNRAHATRGGSLTVTRPVTAITRIFDDIIVFKTERSTFMLRQLNEGGGN